MTTVYQEAKGEQTHADLTRLAQAGSLKAKKRPTLLDRFKEKMRRRRMRKAR